MENEAKSKPKIFVTREIPPIGIELLSDECEIRQWDKQNVVPRDELIAGVKGIDALFCLLTDKIDAEVLDAAGKSCTSIKHQF